MLKKISPHCFLFFYVKLGRPLPHFLGYPSFVNTMERSSLYQLIELKKIFFAPRNLSIQSLFLKTILQGLKSFELQGKTWNWIKELLALIFRGLKHDISPCWCHQRSPEAGSGTWILPKPNKVISILTETHINHDQIHHTRNNWLGPIFFSRRIIQKECFLCFIWVLKVSLKFILI